MSTAVIQTSPGLHAVVEHAHELADAQHRVLERFANVGVRARLGDVYRRFGEALGAFERGLAHHGWSRPRDRGRTDARRREMAGIDGIGADLGLLAELDGRAAVMLTRIGEVPERTIPDEVAEPMYRLADLAQDIRAEYETLSI